MAQAASLLAQALTQLQRTTSDQAGAAAVRDEIAASRSALEKLAGRLEKQLEEDKEQRRLLGDQLTGLGGSLDRLVAHLQDLSHLMADLLERLAQPSPPA